MRKARSTIRRSKAKPKGRRRTLAAKAPVDPRQTVTKLKRELAARSAELDEALAQQTATAEVLQVINASPGDLAPVFDAMLEKALRLCEADFGILWMFDGEYFRAVATHGVSPAFAEFLEEPQRAGPDTGIGRIQSGESLVHVIDYATAETYGPDASPLARAFVELGGARTGLIVALRREKTLLGAIRIFRQEARPFSERQIALLQNFAAQAVIAMENARLINETREALEQQTATAEVLQVINSSPGNLIPVFDAILQQAHRICGVTTGALATYDGDTMHWVTMQGISGPMMETMRLPFRPMPHSPHARMVEEKRIIHIPDLELETLWPRDDPKRINAIEQGVRTMLFVPLCKDDTLLGYFSATRVGVHPFSDKQIALMESFAAQAVIAMENARLINETREALNQQTATAELLQVINSSPGNLEPVFDAMLEKALSLCDASFGVLWTYDGERIHAASLRGAPAPFAAFLRGTPHPIGADNAHGRLLRGEPVVHIADVANDEAHRSGDPIRRALVEAGGRTLLAVSLRKDRTFLGDFVIYRREVRPFTDKQIALLQNFAAQAVIAMENARLINETREALEQQTATAEILQVINASPGNLIPVFDAILDQAHRLCAVTRGALVTYDGEYLRAVAARGFSEQNEKLMRQPFQASQNSPHVRLIAEKRVIHIPDLATETQWNDPRRNAAAESGVRTMLFVPLCKENVLLGWITANRLEVRPFTKKEVTLLESFAAQAVIAMDNARLLEEIRQRQAELRVTFDNMGDGVAMFDAELRLAAWNRNFQQILDLPDALLAGRPSYADYIRLLADRGEFGDDMDQELRRRAGSTDEDLRFERIRPDGHVLEVRRNVVPGGGFVLIYSDVTERKRAEGQIRAARDAAEAALKELKAAQTSLIHAEKMASLGQLTAGIAHEIKNPLNFVNNFAGLSVELLEEFKEVAAPALAALDDGRRSEAGETLEMIEGNMQKIAEHGRRADGIVKSMLAHSRGGSGDRQSVDLNALIEEALNLAYHGARAQDQNFNITLEREYAPAIAPIELVPQDVTRVFLNLIGNGFYAAHKRHREPGGRPVLKVTTLDLGSSVEVRVRDNGTGIAPENRGKLFQPFFTTKPTGEGTGLGLSISYDIVTQQHGGSIEVDSELGTFTEFTVRLPRQRHAMTKGHLT